MDVEIDEVQFKEELAILASKNWKVDALLKSCGGYEKLPQNIKDLIDKELNIKRKTIMIRTYE